MLSHNVANGPESKATRIFSPVRHVAASEAKSAIPDCILLFGGIKVKLKRFKNDN